MHIEKFDNRGYRERTQCAICGNKKLTNILSYGDTPLAGEFLLKDQINKEELYPLCFLFCDNCYLFQTDGFIDPDILFKDYRYLSSVGLTKHFESVSKYLIDEFELNNHSSVLDIGANDGVLLLPLMKEGINAVGIDPAVNVTKIARDKGCNIITDYFNEDNAKKYFKESSFDVVTATNSFAHIENIHEIVAGVKWILKPTGAFVIEVHYIKNLIDQLAYDNLYAEHIYEYSLNSLKNLFSIHDMTIVDYEEIPVHAGSIRVVIKPGAQEVSEKVNYQLNYEKKLGLISLSGFKKFSERVHAHRESLHVFLKSIANDGKKIIGYGASGRANILAHLADINTNIVEYIVDESPERFGRYLSRTHIPIYDKNYLDNDPEKPDYILIFAWNFSKMIIKKLQDQNYNFIIPFPYPRIVNSVEDLDLQTL